MTEIDPAPGRGPGPLQGNEALLPAGFGAATAFAATIVTSAFHVGFGQNLFMLYVLAILSSGLLGGPVAGISATLCSAAGLAFALLRPLGTLQVDTGADRVRVFALVLSGLFITGLAEALRASRRRVRERERSLRESEESYRALFDQSQEAVCILDDEGRVLEANLAAGRLFGRDPAQLVGGSPIPIGRALEDDPEPARSRLEQALDGEPQRYEAQGIRADGREVTMAISLGRARWFGRDVVMAMASDLSAQRQLEEQLHQAQKMEAVGRLAGGVAHDFNNILTAIRGHVELLGQRLDPDDPVREEVVEIERSAELATHVTRQLLAFSRRSGSRYPKVVDINPLLARLERMLRRVIGERILLATDMDPDAGAVRVDPAQLEQVILNLVLNARDAMPGGGTVSVRTRRSAAPGHHVLLSVVDTGVGMDEATVSRVFEPFFTTKPLGEGTGLGLSTVYGIVSEHGGRIDVWSKPGRGTTIQIALPRLSPATGPVEIPVDGIPTGIAPTTARGETVLVVEDEASVRSLIRRVLARRGYRVIEAPDGRAALDVWKHRRDRIHLLLADVVMPDIRGTEVAARLRALEPGLRVLFTSGYGRDEALRGDVEVSGAGFLQKPFTPNELLRHVRFALDGPGAEAATSA